MSTYNLHQTARGLYKVAVVDALTKEVVWEQKDWGKNLILNNGMDQVASRVWEDCFRYGVAGTGVTPTNVSSGGVTASQSGSTVTATIGAFTFAAGDIGNMIQWPGGEEARITGFTNPQVVTVTPSQSVLSNTFTVFQTNQTGLVTEVKRSGTYLPNLPYTGTIVTTSSGLLQMRRTYDFTAEVGTVNYTEIGTAWSGTLNASNTTFSRILLPSPVAVNAGQQLRFVYELQITVGPIAPVSFSAAISGWPVAPATDTNAQQQLQFHGLSMVGTNGVGTSEIGAAESNEPSTSGINCTFFVSPSSTAIPPFGTTVNRNIAGADVASPSLVAYTPLSFTRDKTATFNVAQINRTDLRSLGAGFQSIPNFFASRDTGIVVLFDQAQSKSNTQTLSFTFRYTWSRVLS